MEPAMVKGDTLGQTPAAPWQFQEPRKQHEVWN
jgi:hypothetical protein